MNIFIDIETIQDEAMTQEQIDEAKELRKEQYNFLPEYHRILCISVWYIAHGGESNITCLTGDEKTMIEEFYKMIKTNTIVGFNITWFDIPFIVKRWLYHWLSVPNALKTFWKKPWEMTTLLDLYTIYKMTSYNSASLDAVCKFLWVKSSKEEGIDGSMVQALHDQWRDNDIYDYCKRDVRATIDVYKRFLELNFV